MQIIKGLGLSLSLLSLFGSTYAADLESLLKMDKFQQAEYIEGMSSPEIDALKKEIVLERAKEKGALKQNRAWAQGGSRHYFSALPVAISSAGLMTAAAYFYVKKAGAELPENWARMEFKSVYDALCKSLQTNLVSTLEGKALCGGYILYVASGFYGAAANCIHMFGQKGVLRSLERLVALYDLEKMVFQA